LSERIFSDLTKLDTYILIHAFFGKCISGEEISPTSMTFDFFPLALATMKEYFAD